MEQQGVVRRAFSPREFAIQCGRHQSWAYRLLYSGKIRAVTDLGRVLIPASELDRVLDSAKRYNPPHSRSSLKAAPTLPNESKLGR